MIKLLHLICFISIGLTGFSQIHEVPKINRTFSFASASKLSNGNALINGFSLSEFYQSYTYYYVALILDSNGHAIKNEGLPYGLRNLFEGGNQKIYSIYSEECICVDCALYDGDVKVAEYNLNMDNQYIPFNNPILQYTYNSSYINGFPLTPTSNLLMQDTNIFIMNTLTSEVTTSYYNQLEITKAHAITPNQIIYETAYAGLFMGDTLLNITDTLGFGEIYVIQDGNNYVVNDGFQVEKRDVNGNLIGSLPSGNLLDLKFENNQYFALKYINGQNYQLEIRDSFFNLVQTLSLVAPGNTNYKNVVPYHNHVILVGNENTGFSNNLYSEKVTISGYSPISLTTDLTVSEIFTTNTYLVSDSIQTGQFTYNYYQSEVVTLGAVITNNSNSEILTSAFMHAEVDYDHGYGYGCNAFTSNIRFITEGLAPGMSDTVFFNPIKLTYSGYNSTRNYCVWGDSPNYKSDVNFGDNQMCSTYSYSSIGQIEKPLFKLYPNPANDFIQLSFESVISDVRYCIISLDGRIVQQGNYESHSISIAQLSHGTYLFQLYDETTILGSEKLVKF